MNKQSELILIALMAILVATLVFGILVVTYQFGTKCKGREAANYCNNIGKVELNGEWYTCEKVK